MLPSFFIALLRPDSPMAKLSKKTRHPEAPALAVEPAPRVAQRLEAADQRSRILERLTRVDKLGVGERRRSSPRCSKAARSTRAPASSGADTGELGRYHDFAQARIPAPPEPLPHDSRRGAAIAVDEFDARGSRCEIFRLATS